MYKRFCWAFTLGCAYYLKGMYGEANDAFRKSLELSYDPTTKGYLAMSLAKLGQREQARKLLNQLMKESSEHQHDWSLHQINVDPFVDPLRADPRFSAMLKRLNLPQ